MLRKIKSPQDLERKKRKNRIIVGIILVVLMVLSTAGYSFLQDEGDSVVKQSYNGLNFYMTNELWNVQLGDQQLVFRYLPQNVSNISVVENMTIQSYSNKPLYVVNNNYAFQEIGSNLGTYVLRAQPACLESTNCTGFPSKSCARDNLIIFQESNETRVYQDQLCIYISGDYARATDAFLYRLFGIM